MLFRNRKNGWYLNVNNQLTRHRKDAMLIEEEMVGCTLTRFKVGEKYIGCSNEFSSYIIKITSKDDDSSLFLFDKLKNRYTTIHGLCLSLDDKLYCGDPEVDTNLSFEYLSFDEKLFFKFQKEGMVTWKGKLTDEEINSITEKILKHKGDRVSNLFAEDVEISSKFFKDATLKSILDEIFSFDSFDSGYHLTTFSSNTLRKEDKSKVFFHVDYPYHNLTPPYPNKILGIQVIYALNDFTIENGATMYIPYSFNSPMFPFFFGPQKIEHLTVPKGSMILYRGDLWHSQGVNTTSEPRIALLANFSPLDVLAKDDVVGQLKDVKTHLKIIDGKVHI